MDNLRNYIRDKDEEERLELDEIRERASDKIYVRKSTIRNTPIKDVKKRTSIVSEI